MCDLMVEVGPDHPTLNEGWTVADLAAHVYVREHKPSTGPGLVLGGAFARHTDRIRLQALDRLGFDEVVARVRSGPPTLLKPVNGVMNVNEYFIHHEDVRRGDGATGPRAETEVADLDEALWAMQGRGTRLLVRGLDDVDLTLARPSGETKHVGGGTRAATLTGRPTEISLFLSGRRDPAEVTIEGDEGASRELREGSLGL